MKNSIRFLFLSFICFLILFNTTINVDASSDWANYSIQNKNETVTAEKINEVMKKKGKSEKVKTEDIGGYIIKASEAHGISPAVIMAMFAYETTWGSSPVFLNNNNTGGIKCRKDYPCVNGYSKFPTIEESFYIKAKLLKEYYVGQGLNTIEKMLHTYAPNSDGNNVAKYTQDIGIIIETNLGINAENGELAEGTGAGFAGSVSESSGTTIGGSGESVKKEFFIKSEEYKSAIGENNKANETPNSLGYSARVFSSWFYDFLMKLGVTLSAILVVYVAFTILLYAVVMRGYTDAEIFEKLAKVKGSAYDRATTISLIVRSLVAILVLGFALSGIFVEVMAFIYFYFLEILHFFGF